MWASLFSKTKYNWSKILKEKSDVELINFVYTSLVDIEGKVAAIDELKIRKYNPEKIEELSKKILNDLKAKRLELLQKTIIDKLNKYSLFVQITILPIFLFFAFQFSEYFEFHWQLLIFSGIVVLVVFNIFMEQKDIKKKKRKKEEEIQEIDRQIKKYEKDFSL